MSATAPILFSCSNIRVAVSGRTLVDALDFEVGRGELLAVLGQNGSGKTLTGINLAISIAREVDYTVLLVDANLRHPWMLEHFGLGKRKGLSDYLTSNTPIEELLVKPGTTVPVGQPLARLRETGEPSRPRTPPAGSRAGRTS